MQSGSGSRKYIGYASLRDASKQTNKQTNILTQNYQSVNRLFSEKTLSFIWYVFSTSLAFSVVLNSLIQVQAFQHFVAKDKHAECESKEFSKSEIF
jgi:hypothetical protein